MKPISPRLPRDRSFPATADVAIIGAGPVGLMLAALLGQQGISTILFERRRAPFTEPRAIAFDPETLRCFQRIGRLDALAPTLELDVPVAYYNGAGRLLGRVTSTEPRFGFSPRGTFYQPELECAIAEGLGAHPSVSVLRGVEVGDVADLGDRVQLSVKAEDGSLRRVSARYAVACDGGASRTRERTGIGFEGATFEEKWLVVDVQGDDYPHREIRFFCDPRRPALTLPVSRNRRRWEFLLLPSDDEARFADHDNARALMKACGSSSPAVIERSLIYSFHARIADRFRAGRILLAGDAAHVTPPFAGQGLNGGIRDASNLAWKLAAICRGRTEDGLLDSYDGERRAHTQAMTSLAVRLGRAIMPTSSARALLRDIVMRSAWAIPAQRRRVESGDIIPGPSVARSSLVNWRAGGPVGNMIPQPAVGTPEGAMLLDELLGPGFSIIGLGVDPREALSPNDRMVTDALDARLLVLGAASAEETALRDLTRWAGMERGMLVVRPDRFLADRIPAGFGGDHLGWMIQAYHIAPPLISGRASRSDRIAA